MLDNNDSLKYINEIKQYSSNIAYLLGEELSEDSDDMRKEQCINLLKKYPFAYPFALEISIYLPDETALEWIYELISNYYTNIEDVKVDIESFFVWRTDSIHALIFALKHIESNLASGIFLESVILYLKHMHNDIFIAISRFIYNKNVKRRNIVSKIINMYIVARNKLSNGIYLENIIQHYYYKIYKNYKFCIIKKVKIYFYKRLLINMILNKKSPLDINLIQIKKEMHNKMQNIVLKDYTNTYDIVTIVFGGDYVANFLNYNLASLLSSNNLPYLSSNNNIRFFIFTNSDGKNAIKNNKMYEKLLPYASIYFIDISKLIEFFYNKEMKHRFFDKYNVMTYCHHLYRIYTENNYFTIYNFPDVIYQEDMFKRIANLVSNGIEQIYVYPGPYICEESLKSEINSSKYDNILTINNNEFVKLFLKHKHPYTKLFYDDARAHYYGATLRIQDVEDKGFIVNTTCITPILLKVSSGFPGQFGTIDHSLPLGFQNKKGTIYIARNTTDICIASMAKISQEFRSMRVGKFKRKDFIDDIRQKMRLFNKIFFSLPICFPENSLIDLSTWKDQLDKSKSQALEILNTPRRHRLPIPTNELLNIHKKETGDGQQN